MWTKEWPTEPGWYWFYGHQWRAMYDEASELVPIKVERCSNAWLYGAGSHFLYKAEGARGLWTPAIMPDLPADYQIEEVLKEE